MMMMTKEQIIVMLKQNRRVGYARLVARWTTYYNIIAHTTSYEQYSIIKKYDITQQQRAA
jgi:hypothetical protein